MSVIEAISIQGIRSFDPNNAQVLTFLKPVTIILGQNGSGKTTIIESLKYATTGDFPPGSKIGGSFVHDPKLAQESEIKAKISLEIKDLKGNSLSVSRALKATQKDKNKQITLQTLDSSIKRISDGKTVSISSKCADINLEMINSLGVSKAVLENVIFCHQEESNWPLMEGKSVKQRFDDLFASTRYVKALDSIRKTKMEKEAEIKNCKLELKYLKITKEEAEKKFSEKKVLESKVADYNVTLSEIKAKLDPTETSILNYEAKMSELNRVESELNGKVNEKKSNEKRILELEKNIVEPLDYNIAELESKINDSGLELEQMKLDINKIDAEIGQLKRRNKEISESNNGHLIEKGCLSAQTNAHKSRQEEFNRCMVQMSSHLNIVYSQSSATFMMKNFQDYICNQQEIIDRKLNIADNEIKDKQKHLDNKNTEKTKLELDIDMNRTNLRKKQTELKSLEIELKSISEDSDNLCEINTELANLKDDLCSFKENFNANETKSDIDKSHSDITDYENKLHLTDLELSNMLKLNATFSEINALKSQISQKSNEAKKHRSRHAEDLSLVFDNDIPRNNIKKRLGEKLSAWRTKIEMCQTDLSHWDSQLTSLSMEERQLRSKIDEKKEIVKKFEENVFRICDNTEFEQSLLKLKKKKSDLEEEIAMVQGNVTLYKKFRSILSTDGSDCPLCHRDFCDKSEAASLIDEINEKINFAPNVDKKSAELYVINTEFEELLKLESQSEEIHQFKTVLIACLEKEAQDKRSAISQAKSTKISLSSELESLKRLESIANVIQVDVALMEQLTDDVKMSEKKLESLEQMTNVSYEEFQASVSELQTRKRTLQQDLSNKRKALDEFRKSYEKSIKKENDMTTRMNNLERKRLEIQAGQQKYSSLCLKKDDLKQEIDGYDCAIKSSTTALEPIVKEISVMKSEIDVLRQTRLSSERDFNGKINTLKSQIHDLENTLVKIKRFEKSNLQEQLNDLEKKIEKNNHDITYTNECVSEMESAIENKKATISNNRIKNRELVDTLSIRHCQASILSLNKEIEELQTRLGGVNLVYIQQQLLTLGKEHCKLRAELVAVSSQKTLAMSQIGFIDQECQERFTNAEPAYLQMLCKVKVVEIVVGDLDKYYKALDIAIMSHHRSKMTEINKILKELWRNTYSGKDIDYIEICSDEETTSAGSKRRNYNYRVVMIKSGIRLDMRGRCSAGQKVLASLLIRLALAEVFCLYCGVLSLDEPTTNLDQENIENLAYALVKIIKNRSKQKNFQLILITHDEDFLHLLSRSDYVDEFYKIHCNPNGHSEIQRTRIDHR